MSMTPKTRCSVSKLLSSASPTERRRKTETKISQNVALTESIVATNRAVCIGVVSGPITWLKTPR